MPAMRLVQAALLLAAVSVLGAGCATSPTATPSPVSPTVAVAAPTVAPTFSPIPTKPAATAVPTAAAKPAGTPAPAAATPKAGRPALPAAGVISVLRWKVDSAYVYAVLPTDASHVTPQVKIYEAVKVTVVDAQAGWNAYPNESDGNVWYKITYKDAAGKDATGYVHASSVAFGQ